MGFTSHIITLRLVVLFLLFSGFDGYAQSPISGVVNDYTPVLAFDSCGCIDVGSSNAFNSGDRVLLIQMQGALINTSNSTVYGTITNMGGAGLYEVNAISSISGNSICMSYQMQTGYDVAGKVQLVRIPQYVDALVTDTLKAMPWDGTIGGVLIMDVAGTLTLNADIDVSEQGFEGALLYEQYCNYNNDDFRYFLASAGGARKGEGVYDYLPGGQFECGMGANANGGGGGNGHNRGGGGGGNAGTGGLGGSKVADNSVGEGRGGRPFSYTASADRIYMGGGGGAGDSNNGEGTDGKNGGGIVIIRANTVVGNGNTIHANGGNVTATSYLDASGGGGAGGSILIESANWTTTINISASGGKGGDNGLVTNNSNNAGTGGGGGGGLFRYSNPTMPGGVSYTSQGGAAGLITYSGSNLYNTPYGATAGLDGASFGNAQITVSNTPLNQGVLDLGPDTVICFSGSVVLAPTETFSSYMWQDGSTDSFFVANTAGTYWVVATDSACSYRDSVVISIQNPSVELGTDTAICPGELFVLDAGNGFASYVWNDGSLNQTLVADSPGIYFVSVTTAAGCEASDTIAVQLNALPVISLGNDTILCGSNEHTIYAVSNDSIFFWNDGSAADSLVVTSTGVYSATVSDGLCTASDSTTIVFADTFEGFGGDTLVCEGETLILSAAVYGGTYLWQDGSVDSVYAVTEAGTYYVQVDAFCGFTSDSIVVELESCNCAYLIPNVFTPNNDGVNETFRVVTLTGECDIVNLRIYNRWGQLMKAGDPTTQRLWDGRTQAGQIAPGGTYYYIVSIDGEEVTGAFTLTR